MLVFLVKNPDQEKLSKALEIIVTALPRELYILVDTCSENLRYFSYLQNNLFPKYQKLYDRLSFITNWNKGSLNLIPGIEEAFSERYTYLSIHDWTDSIAEDKFVADEKMFLENFLFQKNNFLNSDYLFKASSKLIQINKKAGLEIPELLRHDLNKLFNAIIEYNNCLLNEQNIPLSTFYGEVIGSYTYDKTKSYSENCKLAEKNFLKAYV